MENVHKIVTDRLRATAVAGDHPDADLLTAFSERALPQRERNEVLEHLARCSECREVVALAMPAQEPITTVLRATRGGLLTWPQLRWGLVAAGVIVVGAFGVLRYRGTSHPATAALYDARRTSESAKEAATQPALVPLPVPEPKSETKSETAPATSVAGKKADTDSESREFDRLEEFSKVQAPRQDQKAAGAIVYGARGERTQSLPHGPKPPMQQLQLNANLNTNNSANAFQYQAPPPPPAPATANEKVSNGRMVSAQSGAPSKAPVGGPLVINRQNQNLETLAVNGQSVAPLEPAGKNGGAEVARAKEVPATNAPSAASADAYGVSAGDNSNFARSGSLVLESARWAIDAVGGLQRSFDQGRTWQDVDVNSGQGTVGASDLKLAMRARRPNALGKDKADATAKPIVFRAVSANGPDVWAGGSEGHLYHSSDAGSHWVRVVPSWRGTELTGDIVNLQFADPQHGRIITSSAEIWMTADGGITWDKQ